MNPDYLLGLTLGSVITDGSLFLAVPVAMLAGLISFLSPCVLPLVPGYLSYVTGLTGADLGVTPAQQPARSVATVAAGQGAIGSATTGPETIPGPHAQAGPVGTAQETSPRVSWRKSKVLLGTVGFVAGFTLVFVLYGALFGALGGLLLQHQQIITQVLGVLVIILGLGFAGWIPGMTKEFRIHRAPTIGLWGAPLFGALFGLGWTPCIGPTLAAVQSLAFTEASATRGALLSLAYCLGLGIPFIVLGLAFERLAGALAWVRAHYLLVMRIGGIMLIAVGLALVTGWWNDAMTTVRIWVGGFEVPL